MEHEEIYIEESNPHKVKIVIIILLVLLSIFFIVFIMLKNRYTLTVGNVVVEVGDKFSDDVQFYVENKVIDYDDYKLYLPDVTLDKNGKISSTGEYEFKVKYKNITKTAKLIVKDTKAPDVEVMDLTVGVNEEFDISDFVMSCYDYSKPCNATYKKDSDGDIKKKAGIYEFDIVVADQAGNKVTKGVRLVVKNGYNSLEVKKNDLKIHRIDPDYDDWNNEMILTYSKGVDEDHLDHDDRYMYLLDILSDDLTQYLPEEKKIYTIDESEVIYVYNKYDFVIGFAIRVKLSSGEYLYLTK